MRLWYGTATGELGREGEESDLTTAMLRDVILAAEVRDSSDEWRIIVAMSDSSSFGYLTLLMVSPSSSE